MVMCRRSVEKPRLPRSEASRTTGRSLRSADRAKVDPPKEQKTSGSPALRLEGMDSGEMRLPTIGIPTGVNDSCGTMNQRYGAKVRERNARVNRESGQNHGKKWSILAPEQV